MMAYMNHPLRQITVAEIEELEALILLEKKQALLKQHLLDSQ